MGLDIDVDRERVETLETFLGTAKYKELAKNTHSFSRKLNEERKMRLPYVDNQTGVAQKHYNNSHEARERMPGAAAGQVYTYPQRRWCKKRYQYLQPLQVGPAQGPVQGPLDQPLVVHEESKISLSQEKWGDFYINEDEYEMQDLGSEPDSESDFDYEGGRSKRGKVKKGQGRNKVRSKSRKLPDDERTPTSERTSRSSRRSSVATPTPVSKSILTKQMIPSPMMNMQGHFDQQPPMLHGQRGPHVHQGHYQPILPTTPKVATKPPAKSSGYCDFCLGDAENNRKTGTAEELISCAECGRSGHPTCLQFTTSLMLTVKKYPWQCIECKTCSLCGTSENDDELLFCDDCDRGYHMYCLVPPMKVAPEGSWSCNLCVKPFQ